MNQLEIKLKSNIMRTKVPVCVLTPDVPYGAAPADFYGSGKTYPVLWMLHGATGDYNDFLQDCRMQRNLRGHEVIVVMPNGINSDYANHSEFGTGYNYTDFFFDELVPFIYGTFPASRKPEDNYISGFSMGGAGALMLGLLHPERFGGIAPLGSSIRESEFLKPYLDMTGWQFRAMAEADPTALPTEYGDPRFGITLKEINMIARYDTVRDYVNSMECTIERFPEALKSGKLPEVFFCCGDKDGCRDKVLWFAQLAGEMGAKQVGYEILEGYDHGEPEPTVVCMLRHFGL
ncbi:MAG: alpha/beta hydrolase [Oscillospiraceae bacterium]